MAPAATLLIPVDRAESLPLPAPSAEKYGSAGVDTCGVTCASRTPGATFVVAGLVDGLAELSAAMAPPDSATPIASAATVSAARARFARLPLPCDFANSLATTSMPRAVFQTLLWIVFMMFSPWGKQRRPRAGSQGD